MNAKRIYHLRNFLILSLILGFSSAVTLNEFTYYVGAQIPPAVINDHITLVSATPIDSSTDVDLTLQNFGTSIPILAGAPFHITVEVKTRGATSIMVMITETDLPGIDISGGNQKDELTINCYDLDYEGAEKMENFHILDKKFNGAG